MALKRQVKCPQCGAPKDTLKDTVLVVCDFCGSFISVESGSYFRGDGYAKLHRKQMSRLVEPSAADARKTQVQMRMEECRRNRDREGFRLAAEEYTALLAATDPELVPGGGGDPAELRKWARSTAKAQELMQFDPEVSKVYGEYRDLLQGLHSSEDPVETARKLLDCAKRCYRALTRHPDYPDEVCGGTDKMARSMVRSAVAPMEGLLGRGLLGGSTQRSWATRSRPGRSPATTAVRSSPRTTSRRAGAPTATARWWWTRTPGWTTCWPPGRRSPR